MAGGAAYMIAWLTRCAARTGTADWRKAPPLPPSRALAAPVGSLTQTYGQLIAEDCLSAPVAAAHRRDGGGMAEVALARRGRYQTVRDDLRVKKVKLDQAPGRRALSSATTPPRTNTTAATAAEAIQRIEAELERISVQRERDAERAAIPKARERGKPPMCAPDTCEVYGQHDGVEVHYIRESLTAEFDAVGAGNATMQRLHILMNPHIHDLGASSARCASDRCAPGGVGR